MYDVLIVGAGFFGATAARKLTDAGQKCLVIDKLPHIAGTAYDVWQNGILVSQYGAHILHTQNELIWKFLQRFCNINSFVNRPKAKSKNKVYSFPINLMTLQQLWGVVTPEEAKRKLAEVQIPCDRPQNFEEWALSKIGLQLYELFIYGYTKKQWGKDPRQLPASIIQRLPIRLTYNENYFAAKYQGMPCMGFTDLVNNILDGIDVRLGVDFFSLDWQKYAKRLIYSGSIDRFFNYCHGKLDYNTLRFEHQVLQGDYQGNAVFNHVDYEVPYLRSVEHKHFYEVEKVKHELTIEQKPTIVSFDYPAIFTEDSTPYYPICDAKNSELYAKYLSLKPDNVIFGGRLGQYKYLDIDQTVGSALTKVMQWL